MRAVDAFGDFLLASMAGVALLGPLDVAHAHSKPFDIIYTFAGGNDGRNPHAGLIEDAVGNFYGTTYNGGGGDCYPSGCGTVFKIAPDGTETVLYSFAGRSDGQWPYANLIRDRAGNLYGTTITGGGSCNTFTEGCGIVFRIAPNGTESMLHAFTGGTDGAAPYAGLIKDASGNLYGTTEVGGTGRACTDGFGSGTIFKIARNGKETVLHSFTGSDGCLPYAPLIMDAAGNLYGTTANGGAIGAGTVFRLSPGGTETVLHSFAGAPDGDAPESRLTMDTAGNLYGTTVYGGAKGGGSVFRVAPDGTETVLYSFCSEVNCSDGLRSYAGLFRDRKGNLYGTTASGGDTSTSYCSSHDGCGTVFKLAPGGTEKVLYAFTGGSDGAAPFGGLIKDNAGHLYGSAYGDLFCTDDPSQHQALRFPRQDQTITCGTLFRLGK